MERRVGLGGDGVVSVGRKFGFFGGFWGGELGGKEAFGGRESDCG